MEDADRTLKRLLRKPAVVAYLARETSRSEGGYAIGDSKGRLLAGEATTATGPATAIELDGHLIGHTYGPRREALARLLGLLAAQEGETRALARESLERYKELALLYSLSEKIIVAHDAAEVGVVACREAEQFLACDSLAVLLLNPESGRLEVLAASGTPFLDRSTRERGDDIVAAVMASGHGEIVNGVPDDPRGLDATARLASIVCSPLKTTDRVFGVVVAGTLQVHHFNAGDLQILNTIAAQAAAAIEVARLDRSLKAASRKPVNLIYGVGDRPPLGVNLLLGLQQVLIALLTLAFPVLVTVEAGGSRMHAATVLSMSLIAMAVGTLMQAARAGPVGSGFLAPSITSAIYLGPSILAARVGGLGLVFGMTVFAGLLSIGISQLLGRFRKLFPPEVSGVVVMMVGLSIVPVALPHFLGLEGADTVAEPREWLVGLATLATIMIVTVTPVTQLRLYAPAIGIGVGYVAAAGVGLVEPAAFAAFEELPLLGLPPLAWEGLSLDPLLMIPFLAAALASNVKDAGLLISCQKASDAAWKRPDTGSMSGGLVAGGLSNVVSGAIGGVGLGVSAGGIGLSIATGAMARTVSYTTAGIFLVLAFMPQATAILALIPSPVMGAGLIYVALHLIASGIELIASRMLDARRIYVIGLPLVVGVGLIAMPGLFETVPWWARSVVESPLASTTIMALFLNLVLNVGVSNDAKTRVRLDTDLKESVEHFVDRQGASWGAHIDVMRRAGPAIIEWCEEMRDGLGAHSVTIDLLFDEFRLLAAVRPDSDAGGAGESAGEAVNSTLEATARKIAHRYSSTVKLQPGNSATFAFEH